MLLKTIKEWPVGIYDIGVVIAAVKAELDREPSSPVLMDCLAELYVYLFIFSSFLASEITSLHPPFTDTS